MAVSKRIGRMSASLAQAQLAAIGSRFASRSGAASSAVLVPFYGQVGTRTAVADTITAAAVQGRTAHYLRTNEAVTQLWVCYANWRVNIGGGGAETSGGTLTSKVGYETAAGVKTQCTVSGGGSTGTAAALAEVWHTTGTLATALNPGDKFYLRPLLSTTDTGLPAISRSADAGQGDAFEATSTDKTISGTVNQSASNCIYPLAIVGLTTRGSFAFWNCDSRVAGTGDTGSGTYGDFGMLARPIGKLLYAYQNMGVSGEIANGIVGHSARRLANLIWSTTVVGECAVNQIGFGLSTTQTDIIAAATAAHSAGRRYGHVTCSPKTTSGNSWQDTAGQTQDPAWSSFFTPLNDWTRTTPSGMDFYLEAADAQETGRNTGFWVNDGSTPFLGTADGLHPTAYSNNLIDFTAFISAAFGSTAFSSFMPSSPPF